MVLFLPQNIKININFTALLTISLPVLGQLLSRCSLELAERAVVGSLLHRDRGPSLVVLVVDDDPVRDVAVPQHVLLTLRGETAEAAVETVVLLVYRPLLHLGRDDSFLLLHLTRTERSVPCLPHNYNQSLVLPRCQCPQEYWRPSSDAFSNVRTARSRSESRSRNLHSSLGWGRSYPDLLCS